ncbi:MAG: signal peptide peptidase SppA [bacterium]
MPQRRAAIALGLLATLALVLIFTVGHPTPTVAASHDGERIALLYVDGVIMGNPPSGNPFAASNSTSSVDLVQKLEKIRKDDNIKAVVIRVNSPGGSAAASQEIYDEINRVKAVKPVYIAMGDICASGGYYISAASTRIWATPATLTGSIGVIMELPRWDGLMNKLGVEMRTMKAGAHKDIGSPTREMTEEEKTIMQNLLTTTHTQFINAVSAGRVAAGQAELDPIAIRAIADGTIWTGEDAKKVGLVDELGGLQDVLDYAAKTANLPADDYVVDEMETSFLDELMSSANLESKSPLGSLGQFASLLAISQIANAMPSGGIPATQSTGVMPQAGISGDFASRMFLCEPLAGSNGITF